MHLVSYLLLELIYGLIQLKRHFILLNDHDHVTVENLSACIVISSNNVDYWRLSWNGNILFRKILFWKKLKYIDLAVIILESMELKNICSIPGSSVAFTTALDN